MFKFHIKSQCQNVPGNDRPTILLLEASTQSLKVSQKMKKNLLWKKGSIEKLLTEQLYSPLMFGDARH